METVSLDSLQAISTCAPCDMYKDLRSRPSAAFKNFRMDKAFEYAVQGMEREVKASSTCLSSNVLKSSSTAPLDGPAEETPDPIWGQRYDYEPSRSSFSSTKRKLVKQNKGTKGKTTLSKFGHYSAGIGKKTKKLANEKKVTMPLSELKLKEAQLISTLGKLKMGRGGSGVSFIFGEINPTVEKHCRKNIILPAITQNPASEDLAESITDNHSVGTSSTAESSEYEGELATVLSRIQLATSQPSSFRYQFGDELSDCDLMDATEKKEEKMSEQSEPTKEFVQRPQADHLLAVQEESLRQAMERRRKKKESHFW